jgi:putative membrane protein
LKIVSILLALTGVGLGIALVVWLGFGKIVQAVLSIGWSGIAVLVGLELLLIVVIAMAWRLLCPGAKLWAVIWGRLVREGGVNILPLSEFGGLAFGARAVTLTGVPGPRATASTIADVAAEFMGEIPFIVFGVLMLSVRRPGSSFLLPVGVGLVFLAGAFAALIWAEHHWAALYRAITRRVASRWLRRAAEQADATQRELDDLLGRVKRLVAASAIHLVGWTGGGLTVWIAYHLLGGRIDIVSAMALEGMLSGALAIAFLVPAGIGVQEASYVALGQLFGMPAHLSLSLSLLRRARDIVVGAPALASWQVAEAAALRR